MKLAELLRTECTRVGSTANDKALALCEIAALAKKSLVCRNVTEEAILEALQDRETLGATVLGHGVAIPHCRLRGLHDFVVGLMTAPEGVDFEADDHGTVKLLIFIIAPYEQSNAHIRLLSALSQTVQSPDAVEKMVSARSEKQLIKLFLASAEQDIETQRPADRNLLHIYIQDDKVFHNILDAVSGIEGISLSIYEASSARGYLTHQPLYAEFADNGKLHVCKVITAIVERPLSNEVIRRVEGVIGSLFECYGVMVAVQELAYCAGSLEM